MFTTNYTSVNLHFLNAAGDVLVPDPRFFASGDQTPREVVRAQLAGPSAWLEPVVQKVATAKVGVDDVTVEADGLVAIRLAAAANSLSARPAQGTAGRTGVHHDRAEPGRRGHGHRRRTALGVGLRHLPGRAADLRPSLAPTSTSAPRVLFTVSDQKVKRLPRAVPVGRPGRGRDERGEAGADRRAQRPGRAGGDHGSGDSTAGGPDRLGQAEGGAGRAAACCDPTTPATASCGRSPPPARTACGSTATRQR